MKASVIQKWPAEFKPEEWPGGVLEHMEASLFTDALWPLRKSAGVAMWPSSLFDAHVRASGTSRHSINHGERLSDATDMHVRNTKDLAKVLASAELMPEIGGIGLYFDTKTPMFHIDRRMQRIVWLRVDGQYVYRHNDPVKFYKILGELL